MVVWQFDLGLTPNRKPAGNLRFVKFQIVSAGQFRTAVFGHVINIDIEPLIGKRVVFGLCPVLGFGQTQHTGDMYRFFDQTFGAGFRITIVGRNPTAIDKNDTTIFLFKWCDQLETDITAPGARHQVFFLIIQVTAFGKGGTKCHIGINSCIYRNRDRRQFSLGVALINQTLFPEKSVHLPGSKTEQDHQRQSDANFHRQTWARSK